MIGSHAGFFNDAADLRTTCLSSHALLMAEKPSIESFFAEIKAPSDLQVWDGT
jgi:hypothetical protein